MIRSRKAWAQFNNRHSRVWRRCGVSNDKQHVINCPLHGSTRRRAHEPIPLPTSQEITRALYFFLGRGAVTALCTLVIQCQDLGKARKTRQCTIWCGGEAFWCCACINASSTWDPPANQNDKCARGGENEGKTSGGNGGNRATASRLQRDGTLGMQVIAGEPSEWLEQKYLCADYGVAIGHGMWFGRNHAMSTQASEERQVAFLFKISFSLFLYIFLYFYIMLYPSSPGCLQYQIYLHILAPST